MTWRALSHPNLVLLLGVTLTQSQLVMISEWMPNGNIMEFTRADPGADRLELVRFPLKTFTSLLVDNHTITAAERRHTGADLHARPENNTR